ncbi:MAG: T9SS type A sorting domain-containing protein [Bacteroidota bacterium]
MINRKNILTIVFLFYVTFCFSQNIKFNKAYNPYNFTSGIHNIFYTDSGYYAYGVSLHDTLPSGILSMYLDSIGNNINKLIGNSQHLYYAGLNENMISHGMNYYQTILRQNYSDSIYGNEILLLNYSGTDTIWVRELYKDSFTIQTLNMVCIENYLYMIGTKAFDIDDADHYDAVVLKSDTSGNLIWLNRYGGFRMEMGTAITNTYDNKLILASRSSSISAASYTGQWLIFKIDTTGGIMWEKNYGNSLLDDKIPYSIIETTDTCYIITGSLAIEKPDASERLRGRILKIDRNGNIVWDRLYGDKTIFTNASIIKEAGNADLVGVFNNGLNSGYQTPYNPLIYRLTSDGNIIWFRKYYFNDNIYADASVINSFDFTPDGGYIFAGYGTDTDSVPAQRSWVIKTDSLGFDGLTDFTGDTTCRMEQMNDTCYNDTMLAYVHLYGVTGPYSITYAGFASHDSLYYSPMFEPYVTDSLIITNSMLGGNDTVINIICTITDGIGRTLVDTLTLNVACLVGVQRPYLEADAVSIFPNPANTSLFVQGKGIQHIVLSDLSGKDLITQPCTGSKTELDVSGLARGVYIVKVVTEKGVVSEKVILQ